MVSLTDQLQLPTQKMYSKQIGKTLKKKKKKKRGTPNEYGT
jgi:hypothetical protein